MRKDSPFKQDPKDSRGGLLQQTQQTIRQKLSQETKDVIMIRGYFHQEDTAIINVHASNISPHKYMRQTLREMKGKIGCSTVIYETSVPPVLVMDTTTTQKT